MKKYELTDETKIVFGIKLFRIKALISFGIVAKGEIGGFVKSEDNLSQEGNAWVSGDAWVSGNARVYGDAWVSGNARVSGNAWVSGNARVSGNAWVSGNAQVSGDAQVYGDARVYGDAWVSGDAQVYGNAWVSGDAQAEQTPVSVSGLEYVVTITDLHMSIGCEIKTFDEWKNTKPSDIEKSHGDGDLWKAWKATLMRTIKLTRQS